MKGLTFTNLFILSINYKWLFPCLHTHTNTHTKEQEDVFPFNCILLCNSK